MIKFTASEPAKNEKDGDDMDMIMHMFMMEGASTTIASLSAVALAITVAAF